MRYLGRGGPSNRSSVRGLLGEGRVKGRQQTDKKTKKGNGKERWRERETEPEGEMETEGEGEVGEGLLCAAPVGHG